MYLRKIIGVSINVGKQLVHSKNTQLINCASIQSIAFKAKMVENASGKYLSEILAKLEEFAPLKLAENWDNVGLLVDPLENMLIQNILLTNDLTEDVMDEAIKLNTGLIISYHPNIFQGMKSISGR